MIARQYRWIAGVPEISDQKKPEQTAARRNTQGRCHELRCLRSAESERGKLDRSPQEMLPHRPTSAAAPQTLDANPAATLSQPCFGFSLLFLSVLRAQSAPSSPRPRSSTESKTPCPPMFSPRRSPRLRVSASNSPSRVSITLPPRPSWHTTLRPKMRTVYSLTLLSLLCLLAGCSQTKPVAQAEPKKEPEPSYFKVDPATAGQLTGAARFTGKEAPSQDHRYEWRPGMRGVSPRQGAGRIGRSQSEWHARQRLRLYQKRPGREDIRDARNARQARSAWLLVSAPRSRNPDRSTAGDHEFRPGDAQRSPARPAQSRVEPQPGTGRGAPRAKIPQTRSDDPGQMQHP